MKPNVYSFLAILGLSFSLLMASSCTSDDDMQGPPSLTGKWSFVYLETFGCSDEGLNSITDLRESDCFIQSGEEVCHTYLFEFFEDGTHTSTALIEKILPDGSREKLFDFEVSGYYTPDVNSVTICDEFDTLEINCKTWAFSLSHQALTLSQIGAEPDGCRDIMKANRIQ